MGKGRRTVFDWLFPPKTKVVTVKGHKAQDKSVNRLIRKRDRKGYDLVGHGTGSRFLGMGSKTTLTFRKKEKKGWFR